MNGLLISLKLGAGSLRPHQSRYAVYGRLRTLKACRFTINRANYTANILHGCFVMLKRGDR
jgi:hypothetical protein